MKLSFDFDQYKPPRLTETDLIRIANRRQLANQFVLLLIASLLMNLCIGLAAFLLAPISFAASVVCIVGLCVSLIGSGIISVLFVSKYELRIRQVVFGAN